MNDFNLATADKHQLKFYAKETYGLSLTLNMNEATMRIRIQEHCDKTGAEKPESSIPTPGRNQDKKPRVKINILQTEGIGGKEPAVIGVQGKLYHVPRGVDVSVPYSVVEVLKNAKQDIVTQDPKTGEIDKQEVFTYPYSIVA